MTAQPDHWSTNDHDPTSHTEVARHKATITTAHTLVLARADLHDALAATDSSQRRGYARSALKHALAVLRAPDVNADQHRLAVCYLVDARMLLSNT
jgi:hypothetical protein